MLLTALLLHQLCVARIESPLTARAEALGKEAVQRGNDPQTAATLIRLRELMDEIDDLNLLAEPFGTLAVRRSTEPHVRDLARMFLIDVERARGRSVRATEFLKDMGFADRWALVGGFENEGKSGCDTDYGPESALDLSAMYAAKSREVGWTRQSVIAPDGFVDMSIALRPNTEAVGYALAFVQADADIRTQLSFGTSGAFRLFVNGSPVASNDRYAFPRPDQQRLQVTLRKGVNRILLKVCQHSGPFGFYFRAEKAEGARGSFTFLNADQNYPLERGPSPQPTRQPSLGDVLAQRLKATPNDSILRADYATVLGWTREYDETEHTPAVESARAANEKPDNIELLLTAAHFQTDDINTRRAFLEKAVAKDPKSPWARIALAQHELNREYPDRALALAEAVLRDEPKFARAVVVRIRALEGLRDRVGALKAAEQAFVLLPTVPTVAREGLAASRKQEHIAESLSRARMLLGLRFDDLSTRRLISSMLLDQGDLDGALEQLRKVLALDPTDVQTLLKVAELCTYNGRAADAQRAFEQAERLAPQDPELFEREGRAQLHLRQRDLALASYSKALKLRPQNPALKDLLRVLRGELDSEVPAAMVNAAALRDAATEKIAEDAVYLADVTSIRVHPTGLSSRFAQIVVKIGSDRGVEAFRQIPVTYSPDRQEVRVIKTRITKPDGSVVDSFSDHDQNLNEPWTGMYYDARAKIVSFPALAAGDVLEVQYRVDDTANDNLLSDYWGDVDAIRATFPKRLYRYVVDMPKQRKLYWNKATAPQWLSFEEQTIEDRTLYRFSASDVPRLISEPNMPGWSEVAAPLHVSTYASWDDVGRYWWGLVRDQLTPNEELKRTVEQTLKGIDRKDEAAVVAAIYGFVVKNTRYVALEFGIHGFKPYRVDRVLARRFGDCKDKASLIVAMLKLAGVDSRLVLLRMRHLGQLPSEPASLAAFNHAIAYVPSLDLYLDGTAEFHGSRELPSADRVANVLVVDPQGSSRFMTTPEEKAERNRTTLTIDVALKPDGSATASGRMVATGSTAPELRRAYQTTATRQSTFERQWSASFPGLAVSEVTMSDVTALEAPATLSFKATVSRFAEAGRNVLRFLPVRGRAYTEAFAPLTERKFDSIFAGPFVTVTTFNYTLPPGWVPEIPPDVTESSPFGTLTITAKQSDGRLTVEATMSLDKARITAAEYSQFRAWLMRVDQAFSRRMTVQSGGQTASKR